MNDSILRVENLTVAFGDDIVLDHLNFEVKKGEVLAIVGPNGAGKTVLFRALLGLIPYEGTIRWQEGIKIGYVPQRLVVERHLPLSIGDFFSLKPHPHQEIEEALRSVGLIKSGMNFKEIVGRPLGLLSGGEFQRVIIAWAIVGHPDALLFDEPTSGIDIGAEETIYNTLHALQDARGLTILLNSHDLNVVYRHAHNVLCLNRKALCFGPPREALSERALEKLYGKEIGLFHHLH